jgi:hypothetical protein
VGALYAQKWRNLEPVVMSPRLTPAKRGRCMKPPATAGWLWGVVNDYLERLIWPHPVGRGGLATGEGTALGTAT